MTTNVQRVSRSATVLEAAEVMNRADSTGVVVVHKDDRVVGVVKALRLPREFYALNNKPEEVKASQVMAPIYRIAPDASTKEAARKILANNVTRLGVFEDGRFLPWASLCDLTREFSRTRLIDAVRSHEARRQGVPLSELQGRVPGRGGERGRRNREVGVSQLRIHPLGLGA
jgi:CBS domain-containing protein